MSFVTVYQCDSPSCLATDDESLTEGALQEAGWLIVTFSDDEEEKTSHFHSFECLAAWAAEAAAGIELGG